MYGRSAIADNFFNCSVEYFKPNPNRILFNLVFKVSEPNKVTGRDVVSTFMQVAPTVQDQGYNYFHIGGLFLRRPDAAKRTTLAPRVSVPHRVTAAPPKQQTINVIYNGTQVKLNYRLYEGSYDERLLQNTSVEFEKFQDGFCEAISSAFLKSRFAQRFYNCHVLFVQPFPPAVQFYVYLSTPLSDYLIGNVTEVIDNYTPAVYIQQERYLNASGYFLYPGVFNHTQIPVNITEQLYRERQRSSNTAQPISTAEEDTNAEVNPRVVYHDATMASYEFGLKDFVVTKDLLNITSPSFIKISGEFCSEVRKLMNSSKLNSEYWLCQVESFNASSQSVKFYLIFVSPMADSLKNETLKVLSPNFSSNSNNNIASLNLSGENKMVDLKPVNISDFLPENENTPMHSGMRPVPKPQHPGMMNQTDAVLLPLKFNLYDFTYAQDLKDPTSDIFKSYSKPLCKSISKYFAHTHLNPMFKGCQVDSFSEIPASVSFHLIFSTDSTSKLRESVLEIISMSARHQKVNGEELIRVGNLYLVWKEPSEQQVSWPTHSAQQSQRMSSNIQQGIQSPNYNPVTPPNTVTRSGSRRSTFARAINTHPRLDTGRSTMSRSVNNEDGDTVVNAKADLTADISYELHNLVYTYDMANETSVTFQSKESHFCKDIDNIYQNSNISKSYRKCSILSIKSEPPSITFRLVFTRSETEVRSDIIRVLEHRAPRLNKSGREVLQVGDMFLVWRNYTVVLSSTPEAGTSMWATADSPKSITDAVEITSTVKLYNSSYDPQLVDTTSKIFSQFERDFCESIFRTVILISIVKLDNFSYDPQLVDPISKIFSKFGRDFCESMKDFYNKNSLVILDCNVLKFRREPPFVRYRLVFALNNTSLPQMMDRIVNRIPNDNEDSEKLVPIGGLFLIWHNRTDQMRQITWNKKPTFWNKDHLTNLPWTCTSNPCGSSLWMDIRLFNFTLTPELQHRQSERFKKIMNKFCADVRRIIDKSSLLHPLGYCSINKFGHNPVYLRFQLILHELPSKDLKETIEKAFELSGHWKINAQQQRLLHLGDLWLQWTKRTIRLEPFFTWQDSDKTASSYSSGPFGEVTVNVEVPVLNLSFSSNLYDPKSDVFKSTAQELCKEVSSWIRNSTVSQEFYACKVLGFSRNPNMVSFQISFRGQDLDASAKKELEKFLQFSRKMVKHNGQLVLPAGNYYLSWPQRRIKMYFVRHTVVNVTPDDGANSINSFINTGSGNQRNVTQYHLNTIISLELRTYNMSENPDLHDKSSEKFEEFEHKFCAQMSTIFRHSTLDAAYKDCQISGFSPDFKSTKFNLIFAAPPTGKLQTDILEVLQNQSPTIVTEGTTLLHIGDLFLKWDENYIRKFATNNSNILKTRQEPSSIRTTADNNRTQYVTEICKMSFRFHLYNFTYNSEISDVDSELFQDYSKRLCSDIFAVYKKSNLKDRLLNCTLVNFGNQPNTVEFSLFFNKSSVSDLQGSARDVLEDKAPHLTLDHLNILFLGGLHMIWQGYTIHTQVYNITFTRSPLTIVILYEAILANLTIGVFNLTTVPELNDNKSETFIKYESSLCGGFSDIFKKSDPVWPLRSCNLKSVQFEPSSLNVHLVFVKPLADEESMLSHLNNSAPHIQINGMDFIRLGDVIANLDQSELSMKPVNLSTPTTWNSNIPPDALVTQYTPSDQDDATSNRRFVVLVHDATLTILNLQVLNMTFIPDFENTSSTAFLDFNNKLCSNITRLFKSTMLARSYYMCNVQKLSSSPLTATIDLVFVAPYQESLIRNVTHVLKKTAAHKRFKGRDALWVDNILLDWGTYNISMEAVNLTNILQNKSAWNNPYPFMGLNATKDITVTKYEATLMNLTYSLSGFRYTNDLANSSSEQFRKYAMKFCNEMDRLLARSILAAVYHGCRLRKFSTEPNTVMFQLAIRFPESSTLIQNITTILKKDAKRQPGQQTWLLQLGGLSLNQNTARVSSSVFNITGSEWPSRSVSDDGWLVRLGLRPYNMTDQNDFRNSSSHMFKDSFYTLCNAIDRMYAKSNLSQRYVSCTIETRDNPFKIIFGLIFRKREKILPNEIITILQRFRDPHTNVARIGNIYFWMDNITLSYESNQMPELNVMNIIFDVINPPYNKTMEDSTSEDFQALAKPFCNYLDELYKGEGRFPTYKSCKVTAFKRNPNIINFHLLFSGEIDSSLHENIISMLNKKVERQSVGGQTAFKVGGLLILKESMTTGLTHRSENNTTGRSETRDQGNNSGRQSVYAHAVAPALSKMNLEISSNRNEKSADPCAPDKNGDYFPHPTSCKMFIQCAFGRSHAIPCKPGLVYDPVIKNCVAESAHADCINER